MVTSLKAALRPLFIISKLFGLCPFSIKSEKFSYIGTTMSFAFLIGYCTFHIIGALDHSASQSNETNFVTITINAFNRYSGIVSLPVIILMAILHQKKIIDALRIAHIVDGEFEMEMSIKIDDSKYSRYINFGLLAIIITISTFEYFNCLMFIQSYEPYNQYCILMCLIPYTVTCITEVQFIAYMQLLKNRLELINEFFNNFRENVTENMQWGTMKNVNQKEYRPINEMFLMKEIRNKVKIHTSISPTQKDANEAKLHAFVGNVIEIRKFGGKTSTDSAESNNKSLSEKIMKLQQIYTNLEKFLMLIRSGFSVQIVTIFTIKFSMLTSMLYACCMVLIKSVSSQMFTEEAIAQLISSSVWIGVFLLEIFILCYVCHMTKIEAKQIGCNLHNFARKISDYECKTQVKAFSLELLNGRIEFLPMGLFKLDLQFMYNLLGAVSSYLIILIQFDMAQKISTDDQDEETN